MRLMPNRNPRCSELEMQDSVAEYFSKRRFEPSNWNGFHNSMIIPKIYKEVNISRIGRISDIIIYITDRRIVNIECKLFDYGTVLNQAKDHLKWADYSYVCLYADTYLPAYILDQMITNGIGLLFWRPDNLIEVIQSGFNKAKDKSIRYSVMDILKGKDKIIRGETESELQYKLVIPARDK